MENTIYYILGIALAIYLILYALSKRQGKKRKSRGFMSNYKRRQKGE